MKYTGTILDLIQKEKANTLKKSKQLLSLAELKNSLSERKTEVRDFYQALHAQSQIRVIAEIKKASPSAGVIDLHFNHKKIAKAYQNSGLVNAISVLTEEKYFDGKLSYIKEVKALTSVPVLRKDFIFDEYQIYESYLAEADALLLIVSLLESAELKDLIYLTKSLGMECLVETHSQAEIEIAVAAGATIIGINARDLKTFVLDKNLFAELAKNVPAGILRVAESGLENHQDLNRVFKAGADAALIGTSLMTATNKKEKLHNLLYGEREI